MTDASGGGDAAIARIKTQHYFTEADEIPAALVSRFDFHRHRLILMGDISAQPAWRSWTRCQAAVRIDSQPCQGTECR